LLDTDSSSSADILRDARQFTGLAGEQLDAANCSQYLKNDHRHGAGQAQTDFLHVLKIDWRLRADPHSGSAGNDPAIG
jgi:hypothetical protein